jgi:hypothetical protein
MRRTELRVTLSRPMYLKLRKLSRLEGRTLSAQVERLIRDGKACFVCARVS